MSKYLSIYLSMLEFKLIGREATVGENIIATTKIRNNYVTIQSFILPILR